MEVSAFQDFLGLNSETYDELACWQELFSSLADSDCTSSPAHSDNSSHFATDDEDFRRPSASSLTDYDCSCLTEMLSTNQKKRKYEAVGGDRFQIFDSASTQEPSRGIRKVSDPRLTVEKLIECLNSSNVAALTSLIQAHTADDILLISPDVRDPCLGQKDLILHFSFLMEAFPDGLWQIESIGSDVLDDDNDEGIKLTFLLKFRGTKVFAEPLDKVFRQLRSQVGKRPVGALHQSITNCIQKTMDATFNSAYPASSSAIFPTEQNTLYLPSHVQHRQHTALNLMRSSRVNYKREVSFYFNHDQRLVRILEFVL